MRPPPIGVPPTLRITWWRRVSRIGELVGQREATGETLGFGDAGGAKGSNTVQNGSKSSSPPRAGYTFLMVEDVFNLQADLQAIYAYWKAWKQQAEKLSWAADTISDAANRALTDDSWAGETADRYNEHRKKLVADLDDCAKLADKIAAALGACNEILESGQNQLTTERAKLSGIPGLNPPYLIQGLDGKQQKLVNDALKAANEIRARVDEQLNEEAEVFKSAVQDFQVWQGHWSGRQLRMLNLNIQQGGDGAWPIIDDGTEDGDIGPLAQRMLDNKINVATMQEVREGTPEKLQEELNKRDPGGHWKVQFQPADGDMGNAVAVRTGDGVTAGQAFKHDLGDKGDEPRAATEVPIYVQ
ncbi:hypothetical protein MOQ72_40205 [Saccharopolyspora sp. K220]|uniref:hypothetical protein n=1 Tax=Saccharopolyspora soli TaxID=2926618 RepID=UPI001F5AA215|nr:hypothetical protein [Saccharopolyspora soli]MCI2423647.1 hypothetical protein [Saccharopolyspora soli]